MTPRDDFRRFTPLGHSRASAMVEVFKSKGIFIDGHEYLSMMEMAFHLNNHWKAPLFLRDRDKKYMKKYGNGSEALPPHSTYLLMPAIRWTIRQAPFFLLIEPKEKPDYIMFNPSLSLYAEKEIRHWKA